MPLLQQRVDVRKYLADKEYGSKLQYLTEMQDLVGLQQELLVQKSHIHESESAVTKPYATPPPTSLGKSPAPVGPTTEGHREDQGHVPRMHNYTPTNPAPSRAR